jgi:hypothetical protein
MYELRIHTADGTSRDDEDAAGATLVKVPS